MTPELAKLKIKALLHDPPEKALILMQGESHEAPSEKYIKLLLDEADNFKPKEVELADQIASGADRYTLYKKFGTSFLDNPEVKHSLSGKPYQLGAINAGILELTKNNVLQAIQEIKNDYEGDTVKRYYALWRELQERIRSKEQGDERLGALWGLLPADTRIPDHSIWEHRHVVSGLAGAFAKNKEVSLFLFTLAPVQEFIAAARKTQDLWAGSYLLSYLSWQAMKVICAELGPDAIIFPDLYAQPLVDHWLKNEIALNVQVGDLSIPTLPNRFLAFVPSNEVEALTQKAIEAIQKEFLEIGKYAICELKKFLQDATYDEAHLTTSSTQQLENFLEFYWASVPLPDIKSKQFREEFRQAFAGTLEWDSAEKNKILEAFEKSGYALNIGSGYGRLYALLEQVTGSRKSLREFAQVEEAGYRCSLIPRFASLAPRPNASPAEMRKFWRHISEKSENDIRSNERLSAIALAKRFFPEYLKGKKNLIQQNIRFPSTSEIAVARFKYEVIEKSRGNDKLSQAVQQYANAVQKLIQGISFRHQTLPKITRILKPEFKAFAQIDGQYLFPESFDEEALQEEPNVELGNRESALKSLQHLIRVAQETGISPPQKYYAVLLLDGDEMGKWLSGEKSPYFRDALHSKIVDDIANSGQSLWKELTSKNGEYRRPQAPSQHIAISRALNNYALKLVRLLVEEKYLGKLIYAGGDDVLALVALDDALPLSRDLRAAFSGHLAKGKWEVDWSNDSGFVQTQSDELLSTLGSNASASVGIAVAHHLHPLQQVFAAARQAEKFAKDAIGRDAFGIQILKRSGEELELGAKWRYGSIDTVETLSKFIKGIQKRIISPKFVVDFQEEAPFLPVDAVIPELYRLYGRHTTGDGEQKNEVQAVWNAIEKFVEAYLDKCDALDKIDALAQLFSGMVFLAKGGRE